MNKKLPAWVMLCAVCLVGALALGLVNGLTAGGVDRQAAILADAAKDAALDADHFEPLEIEEGRYHLDNLYAALDADGKTQGYVGQTTVTGYGGPIEVTAGVDNEGVITGVSVGGEGFAETPGLGARTREAASVRLCTLLDKPSRRAPEIDITVDYLGFQVPDAFVVGWGMDFDQRYRNLPYIGVIKETEK